MANLPNSTTLATPADRQSDSGATGSNMSERRLAKPAGAGRHQNTHTLETSAQSIVRNRESDHRVAGGQI